MSVGLTEPLAAAIELAERVLDPRARLYRFAEIQTAAVRVKAAADKMVEGGNPIGREATMLLEALALLETARMQRAESRAELWLDVAQSLLSATRETLFAAMKIEHARPTP